MKRRNIEAGKIPRRPVKRTVKFSDNLYQNIIVFLKFFAIWLLIIFADFILEFRFEFVWPAWLFLQSVNETFKYQGLVYSVFFICIAITSDTLCLLFIPIHYLFFLASTYVWLHYVWHTDKGLCLPTAILWVIIMYIEVAVRLRDLKSGQFHISLCQPFAAHCIGHPVVTLGIGFKSYVFYQIKLRTQHQVRRENTFLYELLKQALPRELQQNHTLSVTDKSDSLSHCNGFLSHQHGNSRKGSDKVQKSILPDPTLQLAAMSSDAAKQHSTSSNSPSSHRKLSSKDCDNSSSTKNETENDFFLNTSPSSDMELKKRNVISTQAKKISMTNCELNSSQDLKNSNKSNLFENSMKSHNRNSSTKSLQNDMEKGTQNAAIGNGTLKDQSLSLGNGINITPKIELVSKSSIMEEYEKKISKLKSELAIAEKNNLSSKVQLEQLTVAERVAKAELSLLRKENESLQMRFNTLVSSKEKEKQILISLEKRLKSETDIKESMEKQLIEEKQCRKDHEESAAIKLSNRDKENAQALKSTKRDHEEKINNMEKQLNSKESECKKLEKKVKDLQAHEKSVKESETLMSALEAMKEKNLLLEKSLSAETRLKLDLFSALGDAKRQLELAHAALFKREAELTDMKARMSDFLSVMPEQRQMRSSTPHYSANFLEKTPIIQIGTTQEFISTYGPVPHATAPSLMSAHPNVEQGMHIQQNSLDPNAAVYTPNTTGV